jgi:hypothetical protein
MTLSEWAGSVPVQQSSCTLLERLLMAGVAMAVSLSVDLVLSPASVIVTDALLSS